MRKIPFASANIIGYRRSGEPIYEIRGGAESDGFAAIKAEVVADTTIGLLERESVLSRLVWLDAVRDFRGAKDDTVSLRLPAYAVANSRAMRSSEPRVRSKLFQRKIDVTLDTDLQIDIPITDEEYTLDIRNFTQEVISPALDGIVRGYEDAVADVMANATYAKTVNVGATDVDDPDSGVYAGLVDARADLNDARVPMAGRYAVLGSDLEAQALKDPRLARVDQSGSDSALRDASLGRLAGFDLYAAPGLPGDRGYAFHRSAYILANTAPSIPQGAPWGAMEQRGGFSIRVVQVLDSDEIIDIVAFDAWLGSGVTTDVGAFDIDGKFVPATDPDESGADELFIRSVELVGSS